MSSTSTRENKSVMTNVQIFWKDRCTKRNVESLIQYLTDESLTFKKRRKEKVGAKRSQKVENFEKAVIMLVLLVNNRNWASLNYQDYSFQAKQFLPRTMFRIEKDIKQSRTWDIDFVNIVTSNVVDPFFSDIKPAERVFYDFRVIDNFKITPSRQTPRSSAQHQKYWGSKVSEQNIRILHTYLKDNADTFMQKRKSDHNSPKAHTLSDFDKAIVILAIMVNKANSYLYITEDMIQKIAMFLPKTPRRIQSYIKESVTWNLTFAQLEQPGQVELFWDFTDENKYTIAKFEELQETQLKNLLSFWINLDTRANRQAILKFLRQRASDFDADRRRKEDSKVVNPITLYEQAIITLVLISNCRNWKCLSKADIISRMRMFIYRSYMDLQVQIKECSRWNIQIDGFCSEYQIVENDHQPEESAVERAKKQIMKKLEKIENERKIFYSQAQKTFDMVKQIYKFISEIKKGKSNRQSNREQRVEGQI